jgi:hypothetical protein
VYNQQLAEDAEEHQLSLTRIAVTRYKVYIIILLILCTILWLKYTVNASKYYDTVQKQYETKLSQLNGLKNNYSQLTQNKQEFESIQSSEKEVIKCVNEYINEKKLKERCSNLTWSLQNDLQSAISFIQLGSLSNQKMVIDEQKILRNLDQYLIRNEPNELDSSRNWTIESIEIWEPEVIDWYNEEFVWHIDTKNNDIADTFHKLPISIQITFSDKDDLISFVDNIEQFIISEKEDRILYKIDEVSYDIMNFNQKQTTDLSLTAYYFK